MGWRTPVSERGMSGIGCRKNVLEGLQTDEEGFEKGPESQQIKCTHE
jgi:hypothetical protein